jgi:hypothetical protein
MAAIETGLTAREGTAADQERRHGERGIALLLGILFTVIISGLVVSGTLVLRAHRAKTETSFRLYGQAAQFARAGLIEAMSWFRQSALQPVTAFDPEFLPLATPPVLETTDPDIGIVREFQISGPIWGRYEVWKQWDADPDAQRLAWRQRVQAEDITAAVGASGIGTVWRLRSIGYVFHRKDATAAFDEYPNQVLGSDILGSEIRRMTLAPPGQAALCSRTASQTRIDRSVNIQGGMGAGVFTLAGTGTVVQVNSPTIVGTPGISSSASYDDSVEAVFGVSEQDLAALADDRITIASTFPTPLPANSLYYVEVPTMTFNAALPLQGTAVVYVRGDVVIAHNSKSFFTGLLYVNGNLTIREPCELNGTIICTGTVVIEGQSDWINMAYDDDALNTLRTAIGQYRLSAAVRKVLSSE